MKIILMMAATVDGKIAKSGDHFTDWTSREDKKIFSNVTKEHGVVIMGASTFRTFPKPLPDRLNVVFTNEKNPPETEGVKWVSGDPRGMLAELEKEGYKSAVLGGGAKLNSQFLEEKLIDEIWLTIEPKIFGAGFGILEKDIDVDLKLESCEKINENSVMLKYKVLY